MSLPLGTVPVLGPLVDTSGAELPASEALRDAGAVTIRNGKVQRVNATGDDWEDTDGDIRKSVDDIMSGRLGYRWYAAVRRANHDFTDADFLNLIEGARSDFSG